ncbi:MAG: isoleucyl-tRNA synthase [Flavobacteriales bacterium BRH_c54]|nr:MAG: isoleucyl-tRNA synthase [Flavobacteriales bacterium BRH_c54]
MSKFNEYKGLNLPNVAKQVLDKWEENKVFEQSVTSRDENKPFVFFEGPPSANGLPGIHHVMARSIKDIFCRYKTLKGYQVKRKAGWDTHGLPVELGVEKELGITKEDIGKKITIEEYNNACKEAVMRYTDVWNNLTRQMGYWVDMDDPYITYENKYIESVWWLLGQLHQKGLMYKGYTIQPYSPKAGTGLSSHELNQPGCYQDVKDTTCVAQFKIKDATKLGVEEAYFLAWTTTPWTLPSNTALAVGPKIDYVLVKTFNRYTRELINVLVAKDLFGRYFELSGAAISGNKTYDSIFDLYEAYLRGEEDDYAVGQTGDKMQGLIIKEFKGADLVGIQYEQLLPYALPYENAENAFKVIPGDFVTTEDGTGIVHIAPTFGADDAKVAKDAGVPPMLVLDENNNPVPLVDLQGKFRPEMGEFAGKYVKNEYYNEGEVPEKSVDVEIAIKLKEENKAFKVEKYEHSYPHCWRTDKPILYYPLDSWFIKTTAVKERMIALNKTINWKPESTGTGRFGNWLENLNDWNLSRSRYWGIPIPIWRTETGDEEICISSVEQLKTEIEKSIAAGFMSNNPLADFEIGNMDKANYDKFDLHKNYVDNIVLVAASGKPMKRETDLIDVWFDSGSMPYAQHHYPFEKPHLTSPKGRDEAPNWQTARTSSYTLLRELKTKNKEQQTEAEEFLWKQLRGKNLEGYKFRRQHIIDEFIVDFVCLSKNLVIEIDGGYHNEPEVKQADEVRTEILNSLGFKVIRFTNEEVINDIENVLLTIKNELIAAASALENSHPLGELEGAFPADFIAEGVDQTRGWFFTLHAIATMVFDHVAYKNVVSNGLVLDKNGQKMSKRLGNAVDPFETLDKYGPDATRWYMITNAQPWDNLKFDLEGITEVQRKFFGTLYNTYGFFALYANLDNFTYAEAEVPIENRPEIDRWIISKLNSLIKDVDAAYHTYEPTRAGRAIQEFVNDHLSNWYVRLCRRRFWKGDYSEDKIAAYQTLYTCLEVVAQLASPIAPFYSDKLYTDLASISGKGNTTSVHLSDFPTVNESVIDTDLEQRMDIAQQVSSMVLSLRKKEQIKVRQPLQKLMIPILNPTFKRQLQEVADLILSEVNVKEIEYLEDTSGVLVKSIKPNFKTLGPKYGKIMKQIAAQVNQFTQNDIQEFERNQGATITVEGQQVELDSNDVEIITQDIPGWLVQTEGGLTVALDITISKALKEEGIAREFVNRIQNLRKDSGFEVTDKIALKILQHNEINEAINNNKNYICTETLTSRLDVVSELNEGVSVEIDQNLSTLIAIEKFN